MSTELAEFFSIWPGRIQLCGPQITMEQIIREVATRHRLAVRDLLGRDIYPNYVLARQEAMWRLRQQRKPDGSPRWSYPAIGRAMGGKDHTTVMHGVKRHEARR